MKRFLAVIAFFIVIALGVTLTLSFFLGVGGAIGRAAYWMRHIAIGGALVVLFLLSLNQATLKLRSGRKAGIAFFVIWLIASIAIAVFYVLPLAGIYLL